MNTFDLDTLESACGRAWNAIDIGGIEMGSLSNQMCRGNHVHVDCLTPFLIAATSFCPSGDEEYFGLTVIREPVRIEGFLRGPFYPHNKPKTLPLGQLARSDIDQFLESPKKCRLLSNALKGPSDVTAIVEGLFIFSELGELSVYADDEVPMSLILRWAEPREKKFGATAAQENTTL